MKRVRCKLRNVSNGKKCPYYAEIKGYCVKHYWTVLGQYKRRPRDG